MQTSNKNACKGEGASRKIFLSVKNFHNCKSLIFVSKNRRLLCFLRRVVWCTDLKIWLKGRKNIAKRSSTIRDFQYTCLFKNQSPFENLILDLWFALAYRRFRNERGSIKVSILIFALLSRIKVVMTN